TPEQDAILRSIQNELLGPRGPQGQIRGWGTAIGPRTLVAMLHDVHGRMTEPKPSRVTGAEKILVPLDDAIRDTNKVAFETKAAVDGLQGALNAAAKLLEKAGSGLTEEQIRTSIAEG